MMRYCVGFAFSGDQSLVMLIRKVKPAWQAGNLNGIGGHIEPGEAPLAAMQREAFEEAGLPLDTDWQHFATINGADGAYEMFCYFTAGDFEIGPSTPEGDVNMYQVRGLGDREDVLPNLRYLVPLARCEETKPGSRVRFPVIVNEERISG